MTIKWQLHWRTSDGLHGAVVLRWCDVARYEGCAVITADDDSDTGSDAPWIPASVHTITTKRKRVASMKKATRLAVFRRQRSLFAFVLIHWFTRYSKDNQLHGQGGDWKRHRLLSNQYLLIVGAEMNLRHMGFSLCFYGHICFNDQVYWRVSRPRTELDADLNLRTYRARRQMFPMPSKLQRQQRQRPTGKDEQSYNAPSPGPCFTRRVHDAKQVWDGCYSNRVAGLGPSACCSLVILRFWVW